MLLALKQVAIAACIPLLVTASYTTAVIIEFDSASQLVGAR